MDQKETFDWMRSELERLRKENDALREQVERLSKPVSDEEAAILHKAMLVNRTHAEAKQALETVLATRKQDMGVQG
jgi:hypothetical protein